jgi:hypothetical protein
VTQPRGALRPASVALWSVVLALAAAVAAYVWLLPGVGESSPQPGAAPAMAGEDFDVEAQAARHDTAVLRAALDGACRRSLPSALLRARPIDSFDWRSTGQARIPSLPDCPGVTLADEAAFTAASGTETLLQVSLPRYEPPGHTAVVQVRTSDASCDRRHCAAEWEYVLAFKDGAWRVASTRQHSDP